MSLIKASSQSTATGNKDLICIWNPSIYGWHQSEKHGIPRGDSASRSSHLNTNECTKPHQRKTCRPGSMQSIVPSKMLWKAEVSHNLSRLQRIEIDRHIGTLALSSRAKVPLILDIITIIRRQYPTQLIMLIVTVPWAPDLRTFVQIVIVSKKTPPSSST